MRRRPSGGRKPAAQPLADDAHRDGLIVAELKDLVRRRAVFAEHQPLGAGAGDGATNQPHSLVQKVNDETVVGAAGGAAAG